MTSLTHAHETEPRADAPAELLAAFERFAVKVREDGECWTWTASVTGDGYPRLTGPAWSHLAHVYSFLTFRGELRPGEEVDHKCLRRDCVRPSHLRAKTKGEHVRMHNRKRPTKRVQAMRARINESASRTADSVGGALHEGEPRRSRERV